jgi:hypothetical protein
MSFGIIQIRPVRPYCRLGPRNSRWQATWAGNANQSTGLPWNPTFRRQRSRIGVGCYSERFSGRSKGNKITSRMERELVSSMVRRSIPIPSPPVGGMP